MRCLFPRPDFPPWSGDGGHLTLSYGYTGLRCPTSGEQLIMSPAVSTSPSPRVASWCCGTISTSGPGPASPLHPPSHFIKRYDLKHQNQDACLQNYSERCFWALSEYCVLWQNGTICVFGDWRRNLSCLITQRSGIMKFMSSWLLECKYIQHNSHWL